MKHLLLITFVCAFSLSANKKLQPLTNPDRERIRESLSQANENLQFLSNVKLKAKKKLSPLFTLDLAESYKRYVQLNGEFLKLETSNDEEVLLPKVVRFARHTQAYRSYFEENPDGDGTRLVTVEVFYNGNEPASGWRVAYAGYNDTPAKLDPAALGYFVCEQHNQGLTNTYRESDSFKESKIGIQVLGGLGYLWVKHPDRCSPYSVAKDIDDSTLTKQLNAPSKTP